MKIIRPIPKTKVPDDARIAFAGKIFTTYQWEQKIYDGRIVTFEIVKRKDSVTTFPILDDGRILLSKQIQPGVKSFISGFGGRMETGEDPETAAKRELKEETGYDCKEIILFDSQNNSTKVDWAIYFFIAKGLKKISEQKLDGGEDITFMSVTFDEFIEIALRPDFIEQEIVRTILEAKLDPIKMQELRKLFAPL